MMNPAPQHVRMHRTQSARRPIEATHRWAVRRSRCWPSFRHRIGTPVTFAHDRQRRVAALDGEVLDGRTARFGHPQAVEAEELGNGSVHRVVPFGGEQNVPSSVRSIPCP
jgi:hypothetical protein